MQTNCRARAVLQNTKVGKQRLVVTFDLYGGKISVRNAAYVSGDIYSPEDLERCLEQARLQLRVDSIELTA